MKKIKLGGIATVITKGTTPTTIGFNFVEKGINFIKIESITEDGRFLKDKFGFIDAECNNKMHRSQLQEKDILFSIAGAIGRSALVTNDILPANTNQALAIIRIPNGVVHYPYLLYILRSSIIFEQFEKKKQGVAQLNLSLKDIGEFEIPLPSLEEQKAIAGKLDKVSGLIEKRKTQLEKLNLLIKSRFIEMFGDPITNSRNLPTERMELRFNLKAGITTSADTIHDFKKGVYEIPCYGGNGIRGYVKEKSYTGHYPIIGRQGALCGNVQYAIGDFHATEHAVLVSLLKDDNTIWVYHLLKLMDLYRYHTGAAQPGLAVKTLNTVEVIVTDKSKQEQFATFVEQIDKSKFEIQKSLEKLETLKKSLMQKYFG